MVLYKKYWYTDHLLRICGRFNEDNSKDHKSYHAKRESTVGFSPEPSGRAFMAGRVTRQSRQTITKLPVGF